MAEELLKTSSGFAIYLCYNEEENRQWIEKRSQDKAPAYQLIQREARALSVLGGSVAPLLLANQSGRSDVVAMEYLEGASLRQVLSAGQLSEEEKSALCVGLIRTVKTLHGYGIAHLDLASDNIHNAPDKHHGLGVIDYSYCAFREEMPFVRPLNSFTGHIAYASPEQLGLGPPHISFGSDLYSLGLLIREIYGADDHKTKDVFRARDFRQSKPSVKMVAEHLVWATEGLLSLDLRARQEAIAGF